MLMREFNKCDAQGPNLPNSSKEASLRVESNRRKMEESFLIEQQIKCKRNGNKIQKIQTIWNAKHKYQYRYVTLPSTRNF